MLEFALQHPLITLIMFWIAVAGTVGIFKAIFGKNCNDEQLDEDD
jgi:hypothetical protein